MSRSVAWRHSCPVKVKERLDHASTARLYILHQTGPTGFHIKEEGKDRKLKVFLGDPHTCSCNSFMNDRELCVHILWLMVKKFKFRPEDPLTFQQGLIEREINDMVLRELGERNKIIHEGSVPKSNSPVSQQRQVQDGDVCPICQEDLSQATEPLTYCRQSCGKSLHVRCMKMWADHQKSLGEVKIKCPLCREYFADYEELQKESVEAKKQVYKNSKAPNVHTGCVCCRCLSNPITGVCYRCRECDEYFLCSKCYLTENHNPTHVFQTRRYLSQKWKRADPPKALPPLPPGVAVGLENREISSEDYDTLLQLDSNPDPTKGVAEHVLYKFTSYPIKHNSSLLVQKERCVICNQHYLMGEWIRKLPNCYHQFHRDCIDHKLRYFQTTCPVDGKDVHPKRKIDLRIKSHSANQPTKTVPAKSIRQGCIVSGPLLGLGSLPELQMTGNRMDLLVAGAQIMDNTQPRTETFRNTQALLPISLNNQIRHMESDHVMTPQSLLFCKPLLTERQSGPLKLPCLTRTTSHPVRITRPRGHATAVPGSRSRRLTGGDRKASQLQELFVGSQVGDPVMSSHPATEATVKNIETKRKEAEHALQREEQLERARLRGKHADHINRIDKDRQEILRELSFYQKKDMQQRRTKLEANIPLDPPYTEKRAVERRKQRELESEFEKLFIPPQDPPAPPNPTSQEKGMLGHTKLRDLISQQKEVFNGLSGVTDSSMTSLTDTTSQSISVYALSATDTSQCV